MKRNALYLTLILPAAVFVMTSTALYASGEPESSNSAPAVVRLVSERGSHTEAWKSLMAAFQEKSGIKLELTQYPYANYFNQLMLSFTSGKSEFDVPYISLLWYPALAKAGYIQPVNELVDQEPGLKSDMPGLSTAVMDGKYYMVPYMNEVGGVVYRADLFNDPKEKQAFRAKYGYDLAPPTNLKSYRDIAEFFYRPPNLYGVTLMGRKSIFLATHFTNRLWAEGGTVLDASMHPAFNSAVGVEAVNEVKDMFRFASPASRTYDFQEALNEFSQGKSAMVEVWTTSMFYFNDEKSSKVAGNAAFVGFPRPAGQENAMRPRLFISWGFSVSAKAQNKTAALDWIKYATEDNNFASAAPIGTIPTRLSALKNPKLIAELPWIPAFREALATCVPTPIAPLIPEGPTIIGQYIATAVSQVITGSASAEEALNGAAAETDRLLKEHGYY